MLAARVCRQALSSSTAAARPAAVLQATRGLAQGGGKEAITDQASGPGLPPKGVQSEAEVDATRDRLYQGAPQRCC